MDFVLLIGFLLVLLANKLEDDNREKLSRYSCWLGLALIFISLIFL